MGDSGIDGHLSGWEDRSDWCGVREGGDGGMIQKNTVWAVSAVWFFIQPLDLNSTPL